MKQANAEALRILAKVIAKEALRILARVIGVSLEQFREALRILARVIGVSLKQGILAGKDAHAMIENVRDFPATV
ncbi:hypothetical protein T484DRAFT_1868918 [Baffinella frigidus]|nr:hypothetical protein T484DRAFT_1868918 [Cryptophyta sp. CCMP2293]